MRATYNIGGVDVDTEFPRFKVWLFETPEGQGRQDVEKAFIEHLDRVYREKNDNGDDEPEPKKFDDHFFDVFSSVR